MARGWTEVGWGGEGQGGSVPSVFGQGGLQSLQLLGRVGGGPGGFSPLSYCVGCGRKGGSVPSVLL